MLRSAARRCVGAAWVFAGAALRAWRCGACIPRRVRKKHGSASLGALGFVGLMALVGLGATGCATLEPLEGTALGGNFPNAQGRTYYLRKSPFRTTILVCDGGPRDAVCFEKPN